MRSNTSWLMNRGVLVAIALAAAWAIVSALSYLCFDALFPANPPMANAVFALIVLACLTLAGIAMTGWQRIGWTLAGLERHWVLLVVIGVFSLFPLAGGIRTIATDEALFLIAGYALTGFAEEGFFRGIVQSQLEDLKIWQIALVVGLLFGAVHLGNLMIRDNAAIVFAQAFGAGTHGFGLAVLRKKLGSIIPLMLSHFLGDLSLHLGIFPLLPMAVLNDVLFFALGLVVLFWPEQKADKAAIA